MDHEQDRSISPNDLQRSKSKTGSVADVNPSSGIELDRLEGPSIAERRIQLEGTEADLVTGGAAGAPALAAQVEASSRRTTASKDKEIFTNRIVWICAFFLLLYVVGLSKDFSAVEDWLISELLNRERKLA